MSITDELREWMRAHNILVGGLTELTDIADRIDATYDGAMNRAGRLLEDAEHDRNCYYFNWQDCKQKVLQGNITFDELNARIESLEDELSHRIELPKDADGEYIRIGDVLTDDAEFKSEGKVMRLMLEDGGWMVGIGCAGWTEPSIHEWHHCHVPTVEDVLTEFGIDWEHESDCEDRAALLKEYAAKFRFADEKEQ